MEASGSSAKKIKALKNNKPVEVLVISSRDVVDFNGYSFDRMELLLAMGVTSNDIKRLETG